jgi:prefoldin subunit 5
VAGGKHLLVRQLTTCGNLIAQLKIRATSLAAAKCSLREDSTKVLAELNGDFDQAIDFLRSKQEEISDEIVKMVEAETEDLSELQAETERQLATLESAKTAAKSILSEQKRSHDRFLPLIDDECKHLLEANESVQAAIKKHRKIPPTDMTYQTSRIAPVDGIAGLVKRTVTAYGVRELIGGSLSGRKGSGTRRSGANSLF